MIPATWRVGLYIVDVMVRHTDGRETVSNGLPLALAPAITVSACRGTTECRYHHDLRSTHPIRSDARHPRGSTDAGTGQPHRLNRRGNRLLR